MRLIEPNLKSQLKECFRERVRFEEPMARHTSFRIGGPAEVYVMPEAEKELADLVESLNAGGVKYVVMGKGTNLLVKDGGIRGVVISLVERFNQIRILEESQDGIRVSALAGARLSALCRFALNQNLSGLNFALGIPGSVGGAILMNAGAAGSAIEKVIDRIRILLPDGSRKAVNKSSLNWSYRNLSIRRENNETIEDFIVLEGEFLLKPADGKALRVEARTVVKQRKSSQPIGSASAGCFFKNPASGAPAGRLIDMSGLKGFRIGDAEVSEKHANFIVNRGNAAADDIIRVFQTVQQIVYQKFQVCLEPEVKIMGE